MALDLGMEREAVAAKVYVVNAEWDDEAQVWVATSDDVPGLVAEADTLEALDREIRALVPELLVLNGAIKEDRATVPVELVARKREHVVIS